MLSRRCRKDPDGQQMGVRSIQHQARRRFREPRDFEVRYWTIPELKVTFGELIGQIRHIGGLLFWARLAMVGFSVPHLEVQINAPDLGGAQASELCRPAHAICGGQRVLHGYEAGGL